MTVSIKKTKPLDEFDIAAFEKENRIKLPAQYREFVMKYNGSEPESNVLDVKCVRRDSGEIYENSLGVSRFIPLMRIITEGKHIDGVSCRFIPVAEDSCGNYVCLDLDTDGEVFFWDHEDPSDDIRLANSWKEFLESLEAFDVDKIDLGSIKVISSWINPEFQKMIQEQQERERDIQP
jgi:cell wall assembly regulator SMI1